MRFYISFLILTLFLLGDSAISLYTDKYDNIDIDKILTNDRLYKSYLDCLLDKGKCTPDAKELKTLLPDALATGCSNCSEIQKTRTQKVIRFLIENKPEDYESLENLYDPEGNFKKKYEKEAKELGVITK